MGTTIAEDNAKYSDVINTFEVAASTTNVGRLNYSGTLWPLGVVNPQAPNATPKGRQMRREIDYAFAEARAMVTAGYIKASAAIKGDEAAGLLMKKWFGSRQTGVGKRDWWLGVHRILGRMQTRLAMDINVFYRGDDSLIGKPTDYPGEVGNLDADDVKGYAETSADANDGNIGLCKRFFARETGGVFKTAQKGRDSIGGCLTHELSHNYCGTEDHEAFDGGDCYGEADCRKLAKKRHRRAWYNADNIEYFCEDAYYGIVAAKGAIDTGAISGVKNITNAHQQVVNALKTPAQKALAPSPGGGNIGLLKAQMQAAAVAQNPSLEVAQAPQGTGKAKFAQLLSKFDQH